MNLYMAGWSILGDGYSVLDYFEILRNILDNGLSLDLDAVCVKMGPGGGSKDKKLRSLFDQILFCFLKGVCKNDFARPLPAVLGDGRSVDMYRLFMTVRKHGGFESKNVVWHSVAEEIGLDSGVATSVKLCYNKYLLPLDRWLDSLFKDGGEGGSGLVDGKLGMLPGGFEKDLRSLLSRIKEPIVVEAEMSDTKGGDGDSMNGVTTSAKELGGDNNCVRDNDEKDVMRVDPTKADVTVYSRKRKREDLSGMLKWVLDIAKYPCDAAVGMFLEHKAKGGQDFLGLATRARDAVIKRLHGDTVGENALLQKKQKMHPSMYEDEMLVDHLSLERLRYSQRLSEKDSQLHRESSDKDRSVTPSNSGKENHQPLASSDSFAADMFANQFDDDQTRIQVKLGPKAQAEIPEWTGMTSESDSKWLGTLNWPLIEERQNSLIKTKFIGKGRQYSCPCRFRGSVECVRFHIAENKMKLKLELSKIFYEWRFHCMGEEVSLSWTEEEEQKFKSIVRLNPPSEDKCFWKQAIRCFCTKSRTSLVSYYFNVFVLRRRAYQNRVTPKSIDSDDDDSEFGSVSSGFGHEAVNVPDYRPIACAVNHQCTDFDELTDVKYRVNFDGFGHHNQGRILKNGCDNSDGD